MRTRCERPVFGPTRRYQALQHAAFAVHSRPCASVTDAGFDPERIKRNSSYSSCSSIGNGVNAISTGEPGPGVAGLGDFNTRPLKLVFSYRFLSTQLCASIHPSGLNRSFPTLARSMALAPFSVGDRDARCRFGLGVGSHARRAARIPNAGRCRTYAGPSELKT